MSVTAINQQATEDVLALIAVRPAKTRCVFCGCKSKFETACWSHRDLLALDPVFSTAKAPRREH